MKSTRRSLIYFRHETNATLQMITRTVFKGHSFMNRYSIDKWRIKLTFFPEYSFRSAKLTWINFQQDIHSRQSSRIMQTQRSNAYIYALQYICRKGNLLKKTHHFKPVVGGTKNPNSSIRSARKSEPCRFPESSLWLSGSSIRLNRMHMRKLSQLSEIQNGVDFGRVIS